MTFSKSEHEALVRRAASLGVVLDDETAARLGRFVDLLYAWNRNIGLTTIPRPQAPRLHVLDSLAAVPMVERGPCADLGTGAGLPGMVLAIARPEIDFVLVESNRRRCSFLLDARRQLGLSNVRVVEGDADALEPAGSYPVVISRAFRPPAEFLATARRIVSADGHVVLMMADPTDSEIETLVGGSSFQVETVRRIELPDGGEPRVLIRLVPLARNSFPR